MLDFTETMMQVLAYIWLFMHAVKLLLTLVVLDFTDLKKLRSLNSDWILYRALACSSLGAVLSIINEDQVLTRIWFASLLIIIINNYVIRNAKEKN